MEAFRKAVSKCILISWLCLIFQQESRACQMQLNTLLRNDYADLMKTNGQNLTVQQGAPCGYDNTPCDPNLCRVANHTVECREVPEYGKRCQCCTNVNANGQCDTWMWPQAWFRQTFFVVPNPEDSPAYGQHEYNFTMSTGTVTASPTAVSIQGAAPVSTFDLTVTDNGDGTSTLDTIAHHENCKGDICSYSKMTTQTILNDQTVLAIAQSLSSEKLLQIMDKKVTQDIVEQFQLER